VVCFVAKISPRECDESPHLLRDYSYVSEQEQQEWAVELHDLLVSIAAAAEE